MLRYGLSEMDYFRLCKEAKKITEKDAPRKLRIALLADFASQQLAVVLKALFIKNGIYADIFEAEFDSADHTLLDESLGFYKFDPEVVLLFDSTQALRSKYYALKENRAGFTQETFEAMEARWQRIREKCPGALILQSNFVVPYERPYGNFEVKVPDTFLNTVRALNQKLEAVSSRSRELLVNDIDFIAAYIGRQSWFDERLWALYKYPCSLEYLPRIAQNSIDMVMAHKGSVIKCVVVDLDNTLWGGIVGDDGVEGIKIGHGDEGEAYLLFQQYLLELKKRGILLAVCSKNDPENAKAPFEKRPEMVLKENDFAVFVANWEDKVNNIQLIQQTLNIGFDSMVFLDDSPFERNLVRQYLPEVVVPELPDDAAGYVKHLSELNLFETASFSAADEARTGMYQDEFKRNLAKKKFENHDEYLKSLEMRITLARFDRHQLPRIAQLIQRSNQFNLCTRRYSESQCEALLKDEKGHFPFYVSLEDRFGDYGLIACVVLSRLGPALVIDEWVMSCRVLFRGVEQCAMNHVFEIAKQKNLSEVSGRYIPTEKNKMVKDFYKNFGFKMHENLPNGATSWKLGVSEYKPRSVSMEIQSDCLTQPV